MQYEFRNNLQYWDDEILHVITGVFTEVLKKYREHKMCPSSRYNSSYVMQVNRPKNTVTQAHISRDI